MTTDLKNVVVDDAKCFSDLLGERKDLCQVFVGDLVHPIRVIYER